VVRIDIADEQAHIESPGAFAPRRPQQETAMKHRALHLLLLMASTTVSNVAVAQFSGPPAFTMGPSSAMGAGVSALVLTPTLTGFTATGTYTVTITGPATGTLAVWHIDRPISSGVSNPSFQTITQLDGFSLPPGPAVTTGGLVTTYVTDTSVPGTMVAGSQSVIQTSLVNGFATWLTLSSSSPAFALVTGASSTFVLRQSFWLDGNINGPTGPWVVDVPVDSFLVAVPEPASALLLAAGLLALLAWRRPSAAQAAEGLAS
jgi:PEP-CTERM motif